MKKVYHLKIKSKPTERLSKLLSECVKAGYKPGLLYYGPSTRSLWWATLHADWAGPKYSTARTPEKALAIAIAEEKYKAEVL